MSVNDLQGLEWATDEGMNDDWAEPIRTDDPGAVGVLEADWALPVEQAPRTDVPIDEWAPPGRHASRAEAVAADRELPPLAAPPAGASAEHRASPPRRPRSAGPLVAICGLCGGAGATTVAYLLARAVARAAGEPVLVCDTGGPTGGLAAYAGVETPRSLAHVADAVGAYEPMADAVFAHATDGVRVMASRPELGAPPDTEGLGRVLADARDAHALSVVDCGLPAGEIERRVLELATHVVWVLPATLSGVRRAQRALPLFGVEAARREIVVARNDGGERKPPAEELTSLAAARNAPLVLMPHVADLGEHGPERALEEAGLSLDAIRMAITR